VYVKPSRNLFLELEKSDKAPRIGAVRAVKKSEKEIPYAHRALAVVLKLKGPHGTMIPSSGTRDAK
jgi:hypothetical protein